ncbi:FMN-linked oxidoreductase [Leucosporidium creatinivorum]|uniref:FMN-linked oxidoreductase n=1 Tax=Leucosporidium creatinivorum TaxID=106004 RepID=A0A1Y2FVV7_9BASI|nr:FMN-linked oxidoreductase [Leucosporidium creatinivorum]
MPFDALNTPLSLGDVQLGHRVLMASLTRNRSVPADFANDLNNEYYTQRAKGGVGLILSEGTLISAQGSEWPNVASLYTEKHAAAWKKVVDSVHAQDSTPIFAQLWHVGRVAHPDMPLGGGRPVAAPSPIAARGGKFRLLNDSPYVAPVEAHPDPWKLVDEYRQAAKLAKAAGFDGAEIHAGNGYLQVQFLDVNSNHRVDDWGGDVHGRTKFFKESLKAVLETFPASRVGIKINPCGGYNDVGMNEKDTIETYTEVVKFATDLGLAYIQMTRYLGFMDPEFDGKKRCETQLDVLATFGDLIRKGTKTKLLYNGDLSAAEADKLVQEDKIDAAVFGRPWINNPDFAKRVFKGLPLNEDIGMVADFKTWYAYENDPREGYTDYPAYEEIKKN